MCILLVLHLNFYEFKPLCTKITLAFCQQGQLRHGAMEDFTRDLKNEVALRQDVLLHKLKPCLVKGFCALIRGAAKLLAALQSL